MFTSRLVARAALVSSAWALACAVLLAEDARRGAWLGVACLALAPLALVLALELVPRRPRVRAVEAEMLAWATVGAVGGGGGQPRGQARRVARPALDRRRVRTVITAA
jgi:hypothetical protein